MQTAVSLSVIVFAVLIGALAILLVVSIYAVYRLSKADKVRKEIESRFREMESRFNAVHLENLESRLNPHLFKNILNSIQSHAYQTYYSLDKLANVLDYILYESRNKYVTPHDEIQFALNLIEINKVKISPLFELKVKTKIGENEPIYNQPVLAPMLCIDLIENAFKHADLQSPDAFINIVFEFNDNQFSLTVSNKISPKNPIRKPLGGIGVDTIEQRLKIIYKDHFRFEKFVEGEVYIAHLKINLLEHKAEMLALR